MEIIVNNLINDTKLILYINSNDTVNDIKNIICSSQYKYSGIKASGTNLYYIDKNNNKEYMLSLYRPILSYTDLFQTREIYIDEAGIQLNSFIAILLENLLPMITFHYLYNKEDEYSKLMSHKFVFYLAFIYFISRLFINLKYNNNGKYQLSKLVINTFIYWVFFSIICGCSIFDDELGEMNIYSYFFTALFLFSEYLFLILVKEYKTDQIKNIIFDYVKYPFYLMDCFIWISFALIVFNRKILFFTIVKIIYNICLSFELYIEERGIKGQNNLNYYNKYNDTEYRSKNNFKNINQKVIFPLIV